MTEPARKATVLLEETSPDGLRAVLADVAQLVEAWGLRPRAGVASLPRHGLFDLVPVRIHVTAMDRPLPAARFIDAARPAMPLLSEVEVLARLTRHRASATVRIADAPDCRCETKQRQALRLRLCWEVTEALRSRCAVSLVHWGPTGRLYGNREFERARLFGQAGTMAAEGVLAPPVPEARRRAEEQRAIEAKALTYIHGQIIQGAHRPGRPRGLLRRLLPGMGAA